MKRAMVMALAGVCLLSAPVGRTTNWYVFGGDAQRDGWEKDEQRFVHDDVKDFKLLWQRSLDNSKAGLLLPPVVLGELIGYRGFKELAFVAGSGNNLWSIDADLNRMYWWKHFDAVGETSDKKACGGNLSAAPALPAPFVFRVRKPGQPKREDATNRLRGPHPVFLLTGDGMLRRLNQMDGSVMGEAIRFLPSGSRAQALNVSQDNIYTSTLAGCGQESAVWSIDVSDLTAKPKSLKLGASIAGTSGVVLDDDGNPFVETGYGPLDVASGKFGGAVVELTPDLKVGHYFILPQPEGKRSEAPDMNATSPVIFKFKGEELLVSANQDGRLYVLKGASVGGDDHHHYLSRSAVLPALDGSKAHGIWGGLSSWEDADGTRYVLVPVWGPLSSELQAAVPGTDAHNGSVVAFKVDDKGGTPSLTPAWVSPDMDAPVPPVIARGVVFALSNGKFSRSEKRIKGVVMMQDKPRKNTHATLWALDGETGKVMYSTDDQVTAAGNLAGMTIANGRVYFATVDNTLQVFGKYLEH
jgi:hypothetical protein